jgi:hypothetical protein
MQASIVQHVDLSGFDDADIINVCENVAQLYGARARASDKASAPATAPAAAPSPSPMPVLAPVPVPVPAPAPVSLPPPRPLPPSPPPPPWPPEPEPEPEHAPEHAPEPDPESRLCYSYDEGVADQARKRLGCLELSARNDERLVGERSPLASLEVNLAMCNEQAMSISDFVGLTADKKINESVADHARAEDHDAFKASLALLLREALADASLSITARTNARDKLRLHKQYTAELLNAHRLLGAQIHKLYEDKRETAKRSERCITDIARDDIEFVYAWLSVPDLIALRKTCKHFRNDDRLQNGDLLPGLRIRHLPGMMPHGRGNHVAHFGTCNTVNQRKSCTVAVDFGVHLRRTRSLEPVPPTNHAHEQMRPKGWTDEMELRAAVHAKHDASVAKDAFKIDMPIPKHEVPVDSVWCRGPLLAENHNLLSDNSDNLQRMRTQLSEARTRLSKRSKAVADQEKKVEIAQGQAKARAPVLAGNVNRLERDLRNFRKKVMESEETIRMIEQELPKIERRGVEIQRRIVIDEDAYVKWLKRQGPQEIINPTTAFQLMTDGEYFDTPIEFGAELVYEDFTPLDASGSQGPDDVSRGLQITDKGFGRRKCFQRIGDPGRQLQCYWHANTQPAVLKSVHVTELTSKHDDRKFRIKVTGTTYYNTKRSRKVPPIDEKAVQPGSQEHRSATATRKRLLAALATPAHNPAADQDLKRVKLVAYTQPFVAVSNAVAVQYMAKEACLPNTHAQMARKPRAPADPDAATDAATDTAQTA